MQLLGRRAIAVAAIPRLVPGRPRPRRRRGGVLSASCPRPGRHLALLLKRRTRRALRCRRTGYPGGRRGSLWVRPPLSLVGDTNRVAVAVGTSVTDGRTGPSLPPDRRETALHDRYSIVQLAVILVVEVFVDLV